MVVGMVTEFTPETESKLFQIWHIGLVLNILEIEVLREPNLKNLTLTS